MKSKIEIKNYKKVFKRLQIKLEINLNKNNKSLKKLIMNLKKTYFNY